MFLRDLFDLDAALRRTDHRDPRLRPVQDHGEIKFARDIESLLDQHSAHLPAFRTGLMRDEILAEQRTSCFGGLIGALHHLDAATLAAPTSMNLCLDDANTAAQFQRCCFCFFGCRCDDAAGHRNAEPFENFFGLKFVNIHQSRPAIKRDPKARLLAPGSQE